MSLIIAPALLLTSSDPSLARLDKRLLPQQTLMEVLIGDFHAADKQKFCDESGTYLDICDWIGVTCNNEGNIVGLNWAWRMLRGKFNFEWLPLAIEEVDIGLNCFIGTLDTPSLPDGLHTLKLGSNLFTGVVNWKYLPQSLAVMNFCQNQFIGEADLLALPENAEDVLLSWNQFGGPISLRGLPRSLHRLYLTGNAFSGALDLSGLAESLCELRLDQNRFIGGVDLIRLPPTMRKINLSTNKLNGIVRVRPEMLRQVEVIDLRKNSVTGIRDESGTAFGSEKILL